MKIGMVSPFWLPLHGGGEQYEYRLAKKLFDAGHTVKVFTGTNSKLNFYNGDLDVERHTGNGEFNYFNGSLESKIIQYDFFENTFIWAKINKFDIILIGNAMHNGSITHSRELFLSLKALGIKIGIIHHDLGATLEKIIVTSYKRDKISWENVSEDCIKSIKEFINSNHELFAYSVLESPLFFRPDFIISNSHWSSFFIDPLLTTPKFVMHPILEINQTIIDQEDVDMNMVDVLMINPQSRKNPEAMAALIKNSPNLSYRVLKGGWGDSFNTFKPNIENYSCFKEGRVELIDYVKDIRNAYNSSKLVFFPSLIEGYGMAAVEPMLLGTPVVSSNYPAILEAVGDAANSLCPYLSSENEWTTAVKTVIDNWNYWSEKSKNRKLLLLARQEKEFTELENFLLEMMA